MPIHSVEFAMPATVYLNGELVSASGARLPIDDAGVLYGSGFFETFRTSGGRVHHWKYHRARLLSACATAGIAVPKSFLALDDARLGNTVRALLRENKMTNAVFRYTLTAGSAVENRNGNGADAGRPTEFMTLRPLPASVPTEGVVLRVLRLARDNGEWLPRPKSLNYANAHAGATELRTRADAPSDEGLFLSREGRFVVETTRQNLMWVENGKLCYPDQKLGPVAGTCLTWVRDVAGASEPRSARLEELCRAEAIFVLNAVRGITPVREIRDENEGLLTAGLASGAHPRVQQLQQGWNEALLATAAGR